MPANYVLLEKITVGAANASSITFSGIPQTGYTDLVVKMSARGTHSVVFLNAVTTFNGSGGTAYSGLLLYGDGANAGYGGFSAAGQTTYGFIPGSLSTSNTFSNNDIYIPNYTSSNYKSALYDMAHETNATTAYVGDQSILWANTAAITSITLAPTSGSFAQYSTFYLYGVAKLGTTPVIVPYATGGDTIMTDGTYWYHAFLSSGTFTPAKALSCDVLVVAGGGAGGHDQGGGGGAGGYRSATALSLASGTGYTATVGAGGAATGSPSVKANGSNSVFSSITSSGGGGAGGYNQNGNSGGSGAGGGGGNTGTGGTGGSGNSGSYSPVEGYAGGNGASGTSTYTAGGGGGATAVGGTATTGIAGIAGSGGSGSNAHSSWLSVVGLGVSGYLAGGGGGGCYRSSTQTPGSGGSGGGGAGGGTSGTVAGTAGTANTGSGGGGGSGNGGAGGNGGSGIVIVRYAV